MAKSICSIDGCGKIVECRGWCPMHYQRWRKNGNPLVRTLRDRSPELRFWPKVDRSGECWLWTARINYKGYGQFKVGNQQTFAHRFSYELLVGPIPEGLQIDHLCRVRNCVNPAHLEPVTPRENTRRGEGGSNMRAKTHCPQGHPYSEDNIYLYRGSRHCIQCRKDQSRSSNDTRHLQDLRCQNPSIATYACLCD